MIATCLPPLVAARVERQDVEGLKLEVNESLDIDRGRCGFTNMYLTSDESLPQV